MGNDPTKLIEEWFAEHADDGEFTHDMPPVPYSVIGPASSVERIIFTTKPAIVSTAIDKCGMPEKFGMAGRYGLPNETDIRWLCQLVGKRVLLFLGDMDPVDLMIFAWLRASLRPTQIAYFGVNDAFLSALKIRSTASLSIPCARSEKKSLEFLKKVFPDSLETVGKKCAAILKQGCKIELDAIVSVKGTAAPILRPAITSKN